MVTYSDALSPPLLQDIVKPCVAQFAGCHLDAQLVFRSVVDCVEVFHQQWDAMTLTELPHETFVAVGFLAAQVEIAMKCTKAVTQLGENEQKGHRVGASAQGHQHFAFSAK